MPTALQWNDTFSSFHILYFLTEKLQEVTAEGWSDTGRAFAAIVHLPVLLFQLFIHFLSLSPTWACDNGDRGGRERRRH